MGGDQKSSSWTMSWFTRARCARQVRRLPARVPRGHHADPSHRLLQPATGSPHSLFPTKISAYEARLDADILATLKRVSGRPGRKGTAQVWARRNLEEGKGSRAQGEEEYGTTPGSHRHEREHLWRVVPQVNPHPRSALVKEARTQGAKEPEVESPSEDARVRSGCSSPPRAGGDQKSSSWTMS